MPARERGTTLGDVARAPHDAELVDLAARLVVWTEDVELALANLVELSWQMYKPHEITRQVVQLIWNTHHVEHGLLGGPRTDGLLLACAGTSHSGEGPARAMQMLSDSVPPMIVEKIKPTSADGR